MSNFLCRTVLCLIMASSSLFASQVEVITIQGPITPVILKYIRDGIDHAEKNKAECLIIKMDTPGGLMESTFSIDKKILNAEIPVVVYVFPSGGRAASAGVYITYSSHVAAMAPSTNIGSAHPVTMKGGEDSSQVMMEKVTNDAVAHIKGLAEKQGRNMEWAIQAVEKSVSITATEALKKGVVEIIADDMEDLIHQLEGRKVSLAKEEVVLTVKNAEIVHFPMNWQYQILDRIANPNIAYLLMLAGIMGIFFELQNPGALFPGILGGISLILAFFAMQVLPINAAGILLIILAIVFFILEINIPSFGLLTIGGVVSMILGSLMLFKSPDINVSLWIIIPSVLFIALFFLFAVSMGLNAQRRKSVSGQDGIIGEKGVVVKMVNPEGQVEVHGETWRAESEEKLKKGAKVEVIGVDGLKIKVRKLKNN
ncbi:MAG: nodulation protein NfeD [bacterium]